MKEDIKNKVSLALFVFIFQMLGSFLCLFLFVEHNKKTFQPKIGYPQMLHDCLIVYASVKEKEHAIPVMETCQIILMKSFSGVSIEK